MLPAIVAAVVLAAGAAGILALIWPEFRRDRVPMLLYHRLRPRGYADELDPERAFVVYADSFREQMYFLRDAGYNVIDLGTFVDYCKGKATLPEKPVIISFDDGYRSEYEHAFPVLKELGFPAVIFVTVDPQSHVFDPFRAFDGPLEPEMIKEMSDAGITIASHAVTHRPMSVMSEEEIRAEMRESRRRLEEITGKPVRFFAVPGAAHSPLVRRIAREEGFEAVVPGQKGTNNGASDLFALRRVVVERDFSIADFKNNMAVGTCCMWRIVGGLKGLAMRFLGVKRIVWLRKRIYPKIGWLFTFRTLKFALPALAVAVVILLVVLGMRER